VIQPFLFALQLQHIGSTANLLERLSRPVPLGVRPPALEPLGRRKPELSFRHRPPPDAVGSNVVRDGDALELGLIQSIDAAPAASVPGFNPELADQHANRIGAGAERYSRLFHSQLEAGERS